MTKQLLVFLILFAMFMPCLVVNQWFEYALVRVCQPDHGSCYVGDCCYLYAKAFECLVAVLMLFSRDIINMGKIIE